MLGHWGGFGEIAKLTDLVESPDSAWVLRALGRFGVDRNGLRRLGSHDRFKWLQ